MAQVAAAAPRPEPEQGDVLVRVLEWGLAAVLVAAPLPFAAVGPWGRGGLELVSALLLAVWTLRVWRRGVVLPPAACLVALAGLVLFCTVQMWPLDRGMLSTLSPRTAELHRDLEADPMLRATEAALLGLPESPARSGASLSVDRGATASALRSGVSYAALLLVAVTVARARGFGVLAGAAAVSAGVQGLYGVLALAANHDYIWWIPKHHYLDSATGTFVNRNHYGGYLAAMVCCASGLLLARCSAGGGPRAPARLISLGLLIALGAMGFLLSLSRAGIATGLVALACLMLVARTRVRAGAWIGVALLAAAALVPLAQIGSDDLGQRVAATERDFFGRNGRAILWSDTWSMARAFPLAGCGFGTFAAAYPQHRSGDVRLRFEHAHSEPLQLLAEGGVVGGLLFVLLLTPVVAALIRALSGRYGLLAAGVAAGVLAMLLHAIVDFPFRVPASAAAFAILSGALLGLPWNGRS